MATLNCEYQPGVSLGDGQQGCSSPCLESGSGSDQDYPYPDHLSSDPVACFAVPIMVIGSSLVAAASSVGDGRMDEDVVVAVDAAGRSRHIDMGDVGAEHADVGVGVGVGSVATDFDD